MRGIFFNSKHALCITKYLKPYPEISIKDAISQNTVSKMQDDWSPVAFLTKFESLLTRS